MRKARIHQLPLAEATTDHPKAKELAKISVILDNNCSIYELVLQDPGGLDNNETGAWGMTAEQVFRAAVIKQMEGYSYRTLAFHPADSRVYSWFCKIGTGKPFKKFTLRRRIKAIFDESLEQINRILLVYAGKKGLEKGRKARVDCTVVKSNIHAPYDSELFFDATRVVARILAQVKTELPDLIFSFADHRCRAKRRNLGIMNAKNAKERKKLYRDLVSVTEQTIGYGEQCLRVLKSDSRLCRS